MSCGLLELTLLASTNKTAVMGLLSHSLLVQPKRVLRSIYSVLPFALAVRVARGKPDWAFYIGQRERQVIIDDYLQSFNVVIDTSSDIQRRMLSRTYEPDVLAIIRRYLPVGGLCLDVGANVGAHTLAMAEQVGPSGFVHAVEPGPAFANRLRANIGLNPGIANRVKVHELGLSDHEGTAQWQDAPNDPGTASMHWVDATRPASTVSVTTLNMLAENNGFPRLDLVKIDVDGMDHLVIRGGKNAIERHQPVIIFETTLCDPEQIAAAKETTDWLESAGYRIHRVDGGTPEPTHFPRLSMNTLALPKLHPCSLR